MRDAELSGILLDWYDRNARVMPWRISPADRRAGVRPDPYAVWLSEVMLQQTTVKAVRGYFRRFTERWPTVHDLANAPDESVMGEWAGLGYYARARNLLKCARAVVTEHGGVFPDTREALLGLPGIGPYTASAIAAIAFDERATVVDGNVERVMSRFFAVETPLPTAKPELTRLAERLTPDTRPGDYAQAVMDLGATICTPRSPACGICPWVQGCAGRTQGIAAELPRKIAKSSKPIRQGQVWIATSGNSLLLERRPEKGLLGGMLGFPGDGWDGIGTGAPASADWREIGEVRHTFTHFHLILRVHVASLSSQGQALRGDWIARKDFRPEDLPALMRKAWDVASAALTSY